MRTAVICTPKRTAVGRFGGAFRDVAPQDLASTVVRGILGTTHLAADAVDDVILGNCYPTMDAPAIGRVVALNAGLRVDVPGVQLDRRCGSGLQAIIYAAMQVQTGVSDLVIAGGTESMSRAPFYSNDTRWGIRQNALLLHDSLARGRVTAGGRHHPVPGGMLETAENLRRDYRISRIEQDELAQQSHERATDAQRCGLFAEEIVPVMVSNRRGEQFVVDDEHIRPDTTIEGLTALTPILQKVDGSATVTAGNSSGQNDGAAACIVTHPERAAELGLRPLARLASWAVAGVSPATMGLGPVPATYKALRLLDIDLADIDLIELNEAFAAQVLACTREWKFTASDFDRLNVRGSGISLGHPVGATGARILTTLLHEMHRRHARYGLETMCIGGGQGISAIFERVDAP
ncbi:acetyl-CoA C-acetyltransferase [Nocardia sp. NPDC047038]|uniref:acetyl-CoA C-acetyltransferase n=1 Tax=Nocardia sp. NPDC047038 TaxID=3154338 RepID=UPI0033C57EE3